MENNLSQVSFKEFIRECRGAEKDLCSWLFDREFEVDFAGLVFNDITVLSYEI